METRVMITIVIPDDSITAEARITVSKWDGTQLVGNRKVYDSEARIRPVSFDENLYPWTVAAVRDVTDDAISVMLTKMTEGEPLLMQPVVLHQET